MTRRHFLHIGMHKTGSTAIQLSLNGHDDGRTAYLKLAQANHSYGMVMLFCSEQAAGLLQAGWAKSVADLELKLNETRQRAEAQISGSRKHLIVSGEEMSNRFRATEIERLRAFFAPHFDEIRVIVYLRAPHAHMASGLQEILKTRPCSILQPPFPRYRKRLAPWEDAFGRAAMHYVLFAPEALKDQDVVSDFAARVGITTDQVKSRRANESMSAEAFAMLYRLRNGPRPSRLAWPDERVQTVSQRNREFGKQRFALAESIWPTLSAAQLADIAWAEDRIGRRFPAEAPRPDAVIFRSEADIMAFAARNDAAIRSWSRQIMPWRQILQTRLFGLVEGS